VAQGGDADDLEAKSSTEMGKRGRSQRGIPGAAHLGRGGTERWPAAALHGGRLG
jgi:hypothetical protein